MKWHHHLSRAYWLRIRAKRYPHYARRLGADPPVLDQLDLAMDLLWPFARRVKNSAAVSTAPIFCATAVAIH